MHMMVPGSKPIIFHTVTEKYRTMCGDAVPGTAVVTRWDLVGCDDCLAAGVEQALQQPGPSQTTLGELKQGLRELGWKWW